MIGPQPSRARGRDNAAVDLLLFDIDGTLLMGATDAHRGALHAAVHEVWGIEDPAGAHVVAAGRTDPAIARQILLHFGVPARKIDDGMLDFRERCVAHFARLCPPSLADKVAPGVVDLLAQLDLRDGVALALLTGNLEPIAHLKLSRAGIGHHFPRGAGGFGSDAEDRTDLPAIARRRAGRDGLPHPRERTIVIGDTPLDIACARADRLRVLAVATGPYAAQDLADADAVVPDAVALATVLEAQLAA
jgi:phosphoglycolate phosphatase-like HAD superfamily hydrolase